MKNGRVRPSAFKWLWPGMHVKRWLLLLLVGIVALGLGFAYILRDIYQTWTFPSGAYYITLQFLGRGWRALLFGAVGVAAVVVAIWKLNRSLLAVFWQPGAEHFVDVVYRYRQRERGPKVVAIGGGTGLSTLLRGLKRHTTNVTAIVTVADDGGSSGRLRRDLGLLPPGDFRNCIAALANDESLTTQLFQYRFPAGSDLGGHSFGNLFIAAMAGVTGNFERAILESGRVLAIQGQILPATLENVTLCAELRQPQEDGVRLQRVAGESHIPAQGWPIERVYLEPDGVRAYPGALRAILDADLIVVGPGSLYTSILPNLLVEDIAQAIRASRALKVYVCNIATQRGETDGFSVEDHLQALEMHIGPTLCPYVVVNDQLGMSGSETDYDLVRVRSVVPATYQLISADVVDAENSWRHDPQKLAKVLFDLYMAEHERAAPEDDGDER